MIQTSFFPTEEEPEEIIPIHPEGFKPKKLEDVLPHLDILKDTYIIYPNGGYHPFYGVPNTLPRYQEKIWPFIKRIKFNDKWKGDKVLNRVRRGSLRENSSLSQVNAYLQDGYLVVSVHSNAVHLKNEYTRQRKTKPGHTKYLAPGKLKLLLHRIVGYAWVPNPHNKPLCMHLNDDRTNCLPENLKWGTPGENNKGTIKRRPDTMEQKYLNCVMKGYIKG